MASGIHYATGAGVFTPAGYAEALRKFGESINPAIRRGLGRAAKIPRAIYIARFTSRNVGKAIFGKKKSGAYKLVKTRVTGPKGSLFVLSIELRGFAALQETGGRTLAHKIEPKTKKALKLKVPSLGNVIRREVQHPGSRIAADPSAPKAFEQAAGRIKAELDKAISEFQFRGIRIASSERVA